MFTSPDANVWSYTSTGLAKDLREKIVCGTIERSFEGARCERFVREYKRDVNNGEGPAMKSIVSISRRDKVVIDGQNCLDRYRS